MIVPLALTPAIDITFDVDGFRPGRPHRPRSVVAVAGGKALNLARAAHRSGARVTAVAAIGGETGGVVAEALRREGIAHVIVDAPASTRYCVTIADRQTASLSEVYDNPRPLGDAAWECVVGLVGSTAAGTWLVLSGSTPPDVGERRLEQLLTLARTRNLHVAVDTHGPALSALIGGALPAPAVIKVNREEARAVLGAPAEASAIDLAEGLHERGVGVAVVTDGGAGCATVSAQGGFVTAVPDGAGGSYPVGSGDCFFAGLLAALDEPARRTVAGGAGARRSLEHAIARATGMAAANAREPGAAVFDPAEAERIAGLVRHTRCP